MSLPYKYSLSKSCCGCKRLVLDAFDDSSIHANWTQAAGSWSEDANGLYTSSTSALIIRTEAGAESRRITAVIDSTQTPTMWSPAILGKLKLILGYLDANNYYYLEIEFFSFSGTRAKATLRKMISGSDTPISGTIWLGTRSGAYEFALCWDDGRLSFLDLNHGGASTFDITAKVASLPGALAGLGTGATANTLLRFTAATDPPGFEYWTKTDDSDDCPVCRHACCRDTIINGTFSILVAGTTGAWYVDLIGTWAWNSINTEYVGLGSPCRWSNRFTIADPMTDPPPWWTDVTLDYYSTTRTRTIKFRNPQSPYQTKTFTETDVDSCSDDGVHTAGTGETATLTIT